MSDNNSSAAANGTLTLAIDIGGSHLKAGVLSDAGAMVSGPVRVKTPKPAKPTPVVGALVELTKQLGAFGKAGTDAERRQHPGAWGNQWAGVGVCIDDGYRDGFRAIRERASGTPP